MEWMREIDEIKGSALKELANIGISHVATAIGEIARERVAISLPELQTYSKRNILDSLQRDGGVAAAYLEVNGISDLTETLMLFPPQDMGQLMDRFINQDATGTVDIQSLSLSEQESIFTEIATVIAAAYFSAVESMFNVKTGYSSPIVSLGTQGLARFVEQTVKQDEGISVTVSFFAEITKCKGELLLIPDPKTMDVFFRSIGLAM